MIVTVIAAPAGAQRSSSEPLWRALAVFRFASLGYAALRLAVIDRAEYSRPDWAWAVIAVMAAWTVGTTIAYARPDRRTRLLLSADLAVTVGLLLSTAALQYPHPTLHGVMPVTATWTAGPVLAWAVRYGRRLGTIAGLIMACCDLALVRGGAFSTALNGVVLLLLAGAIVGHLARLAAEVEAERQHVIEVEAASREGNAWPATSTTQCCRFWRSCSGGAPKRAVRRLNSADWRASRKPRSGRWWEAGWGAARQAVGHRARQETWISAR